MARVALVTGGTRGIGAAISLALKAQGRTVIANYAGNDEAAKAFHGETGIRVQRFDVGKYCIFPTADSGIDASRTYVVASPDFSSVTYQNIVQSWFNGSAACPGGWAMVFRGMGTTPTEDTAFDYVDGMFFAVVP